LDGETIKFFPVIERKIDHRTGTKLLGFPVRILGNYRLCNRGNAFTRFCRPKSTNNIRQQIFMQGRTKL